VYRINLVDEVTQGQMVACVAAIAQSHLKPVLQDILDRFPFVIRGFHSDNGSEFINDMVSGLLRDLLIEQTKSRARKSNDNGLVESKNGAVIRKHMGYGYIAAEHAEDIHAFYPSAFNPYLNFHRPCGQPERIVDQRGKEKFVYKRYATPWETVRTLEPALPPGQSYLKPAVSIEGLDRIAQTHSDTQAARRMQEAKRKLFLGFRQERKSAGSPAKPWEAPWKCRAVENQESQNQVSLPFPPPLEIAPRFPHSHRAYPCSSPSKTKERNPATPLCLPSPLQARSSIRKCSLGPFGMLGFWAEDGPSARGGSGPNFVGRLYRYDPRDALHDLLVLLSLLQVVGCLQSHPYFRRAAKQAGHLQAHDGGQGLAPRQNVVKHLAGHAQSFRRGCHGQADGRQDVFLDNLARMDGRQSVPFLHNFLSNGSLQNRYPRRFRLTSRK
jgi:hypothetical protein